MNCLDILAVTAAMGVYEDTVRTSGKNIRLTGVGDHGFSL